MNAGMNIFGMRVCHSSDVEDRWKHLKERTVRLNIGVTHWIYGTQCQIHQQVFSSLQMSVRRRQVALATNSHLKKLPASANELTEHSESVTTFAAENREVSKYKPDVARVNI